MTTSMVDWTVAFTTANKLVQPGPAISRTGAAEVVADLRDCAVRAESYVGEVTGLHAASGTAPVLVIDRPRWIQANIDGFRQVLAPLTAKAAEKMSHPESGPGRHRRPDHRGRGRCAAELSGAEGARPVRSVLSRPVVRPMGTRTGPLPGPGVACCSWRPTSWPSSGNSTSRRTTSGSGSACTRRPTGCSSPPCRGCATISTPSSPSSWVRPTSTRPYWRRCCATPSQRIVESLRNDEELSIVDLVQTPAQRETVDKITGVMSLLEGHADVVMDGVGPAVIPSIERIRQKFNVRRQGQGFDKIIRRLLGLDAKMRQYRDGAEFCRQVIAEGGHARTQRGLDLTGDAADPGRDRPAVAVAGAGPSRCRTWLTPPRFPRAIPAFARELSRADAGFAREIGSRRCFEH